jgi:hypothetical protein
MKPPRFEANDFTAENAENAEKKKQRRKIGIKKQKFIVFSLSFLCVLCGEIFFLQFAFVFLILELLL